MNVLSVSTPGHPDWRWRIVGYHGETVEESYTAFPTIAEAVANVFSVTPSAMLPSCVDAGEHGR